MKSRAQALVRTLPLSFVENRGQEDRRVAFTVAGRDVADYFTDTGLTFAVPRARRDQVPVRLASLTEAPPARQRWAVRLEFVGADRVTPRGAEPTPTVVS